MGTLPVACWFILASKGPHPCPEPSKSTMLDPPQKLRLGTAHAAPERTGLQDFCILKPKGPLLAAAEFIDFDAHSISDVVPSKSCKIVRQFAILSHIADYYLCLLPLRP